MRARRVARLTALNSDTEAAASPTAEGDVSVGNHEPEPEPEPMQSAVPAHREPVAEWNEAALAFWLRDEMLLPEVAKAATCEGVDGGEAVEMDIQMWMELGATRATAAKIFCALKQPSARWSEGKMA